MVLVGTVVPLVNDSSRPCTTSSVVRTRGLQCTPWGQCLLLLDCTPRTLHAESCCRVTVVVGGRGPGLQGLGVDMATAKRHRAMPKRMSMFTIGWG